MCVACHQKNEPNYPSLLLLGVTENSCGDCHMKPEVADASWVLDADRPVRLTVRAEDGAGEEARALAEGLVSEALRARGFRLVAGGEAELEVTVALRVRALRDDRFLPPDTPVRDAVLDAALRMPGEEEPFVRRLGASKPEWGETEAEAVERAIRDAWAVLSSHLIEALGTY